MQDENASPLVENGPERTPQQELIKELLAESFETEPPHVHETYERSSYMEGIILGIKSSLGHLKENASRMKFLLDEIEQSKD